MVEKNILNKDSRKQLKIQSCTERNSKGTEMQTIRVGGGGRRQSRLETAKQAGFGRTFYSMRRE
jgi:hypothetical protein